MNEIDELVQSFSIRQQELMGVLLSLELNSKHNVIIDAIRGHINAERIQEYLEHCASHKGESDFEIIVLIRLLFIMKNSIESGSVSEDVHSLFYATRVRIEEVLGRFCYWPRKGKSSKVLEDIVFWSENHVLMTLGSAHLARQWLLSSNAPCQNNFDGLEDNLLIIYLRAHTEFNGEYETCSHVYIPYSACALLNLIDFSQNEQIRLMSIIVLDNMLSHILATTSSDGIANLSATSRGFHRTRLRNWGHNINHLVRLLVGKSPEHYSATAITSFIATTQWKPTAVVYKYYLRFDEMIRKSVNHMVEDTRSVYIQANVDLVSGSGRRLVDPEELVPFYWSAGLIVHPQFARETLQYQVSRGLQNNRHLKPLSWLPQGLAETVLRNSDHFTEGQCYTGVTLNAYKTIDGAAVLSSLTGYSGGICSFQQLPWMANIGGLGVWSQSGSGSEGIAGFAITNTHNPYLLHDRDVLIAAYSLPSSATGAIINLLGNQVRMFWPDTEFDEICTSPSESGKKKKTKPLPLLSLIGGSKGKTITIHKANTWWFGRKGSSVIGVMCNRETQEDRSRSRDASYQANENAEPTMLKRRVCLEANHAWVVVVGSLQSFDNDFDAFVNRCESIAVSDRKNSCYEVTVIDPFHIGESTFTVKCR